MKAAAAVTVATLLAVPLAAVAAVSPVPHAGVADVDACRGPVERPGAAGTVVSTLGLKTVGEGYVKRPTLLVGFDRDGTPTWALNASDRGRFYGRTVRATPRGLLYVSTADGHTVVELLDDDRRPVWSLRFGVGTGPRGDVEARDALLVEDGLLVAGRDRLVVFDRDGGSVRWTWTLPSENGTGGEADARINGVADSPEGYLVAVERRGANRTGYVAAVQPGAANGTVEWRVPDLVTPYSPQWVGEGGPTDGGLLVAESDAGRVVEFARRNGTWTRVWTLDGFGRPRSAERLPDGSTLVADRRDHRVVSVGPDGAAVWTAFVPWEPSHATRATSGDRPDARTLGTAGRHEVRPATATYDELEVCEAALLALAPNRTDRALETAPSSGTLVLAVLALLALGAGIAVASRL